MIRGSFSLKAIFSEADKAFTFLAFFLHNTVIGFYRRVRK